MDSDQKTANPAASENFGTKDYLDAEGRRVILRTPSLRFICCLCDKTFKKKLPCVKHVTITHKIEVNEVKREGRKTTTESTCPHCDKNFTQRNNLYRHIRVAHGGKGLSELLREENRTKNVACPICSQYFATVSGVNRHIRRHHAYDLEARDQNSSSDMIRCLLCEMNFATEVSYSSHMKNYHHAVLVSNIDEDGENEQCYQCCLCGTQMKELSDLKDHLSNTHEAQNFSIEITSDSEDRNPSGQIFNCDKCHISFGKEEIWRSHMKDEHKAFPESCCQKCGGSFKTIHDLRCHLKDIHFIAIPERSSNVAPKRTSAKSLELARNEWNAMEKIPDWLVKHGGGQILLLVHRDI